jgi:hypothetical protein
MNHDGIWDYAATWCTQDLATVLYKLELISNTAYEAVFGKIYLARTVRRKIPI